MVISKVTKRVYLKHGSVVIYAYNKGSTRYYQCSIICTYQWLEFSARRVLEWIELYRDYTGIYVMTSDIHHPFTWDNTNQYDLHEKTSNTTIIRLLIDAY